MEEHRNDSTFNKSTFAGKYNCYHLIYFEEYALVNDAINREKEIKLLNREKKESLINILNPKWEFYTL
ncbi:MAG: hypothetical protein M9958_03595 [Chitinophagales bacterium]|nr:hypothetical protein [Chitinophagales bacterium]